MKKYANIGGLVGLVLILAGLISYSINSVLNTLATILLIVGLALGIAFVVFKFEQIRSALSSRSVKFGSNVFLMSVIVLGILILVNFITHQHTWRKDTTAAKQFSLAEQTKKIMKSLNKEVKLIAFFKPENEERIKDLIEEYAQLSNKLKYEFIDPDQDPATAKRYAQKGNLTYGTTIIECQGKEERITTVKEEDLTNAIIKVTRDEVKKVYFTTGHGENDIDGESLDKNSYSTVKETIKNENYEVEKLLLAEKDAVPEDCAVLVISGPKTEFYPKEINLIEDYLKRGGKALFMLDPPIDQAPLASLTDVLDKWGVIVGNDLVVDASGMGRFFGIGPSMPIVSQYAEHEITKKFKNYMSTYPLVRSVTPKYNPGGGLNVEWLAKTSPQSWGETNLRDLRAQFNEGEDIRGPVTIAAVITKDVTSTSDNTSEGKKKTRIVVFGDSDFANNSLFHQSINGDFFMNAISWLAEEEDLVSIRPRDPEDRRVTLTAKQSKIIFWLGVVLIPVAILAAGIGVYVKRR